MVLFISFLLAMAGCVNWLLIGLLQYDFVAGIFGYQGSVFSRIIYIIIGAGAIFFAFKVVTQKGKVELFNFKKKREKTYQAKHQIEADREYHHRHNGYEYDDGRFDHNIESAHESHPKTNLDDLYGSGLSHDYDSLFDEHFSNDN